MDSLEILLKLCDEKINHWHNQKKYCLELLKKIENNDALKREKKQCERELETINNKLSQMIPIFQLLSREKKKQKTGD